MFYFIYSIFHTTLLQNDVRKTDRFKGHGTSRLGILQFIGLDKGTTYLLS